MAIELFCPWNERLQVSGASLPKHRSIGFRLTHKFRVLLKQAGVPKMSRAGTKTRPYGIWCLCLSLSNNKFLSEELFRIILDSNWQVSRNTDHILIPLTGRFMSRSKEKEACICDTFVTRLRRLPLLRLEFHGRVCSSLHCDCLLGQYRS